MTWITGAAALGVVAYGGWLVFSQLMFEWLRREPAAVPETMEEAPAALHPAR
jgi:hypothetical protein